MVVFCGQPGRIVAIQDPCAPAIGRLITLEGYNSTSFNSLITSVGISSMGNFQMMHTLGQGLYLYVFGDKVGSVRVQGMSFSAGCGGTGASGMENMLRYYEANRLAARAAPMSLTIGTGITLVGYLAGINVQTQDPEQRISNFDLSFMQIPR